MSEFWDDNKGIIVMVMILVVVVAASIFLAAQDERQWSRYAKQHHCIAKGTKRGQVSTGIGVSGDGKAVTTTSVSPDQTIYVCDGGEMQIR